MYAIVAKESTYVLPEYFVLVSICYYPNCGFKPTEKMIGMVGRARSLEQAHKLIADDKKAMGETYGGLIEPVRLKQRTYSIQRSTGWEPVQ